MRSKADERFDLILHLHNRHAFSYYLALPTGCKSKLAVKAFILYLINLNFNNLRRGLSDLVYHLYSSV